VEKRATGKSRTSIRSVLLHGNDAIGGNAELAGAFRVRTGKARRFHFGEPANESRPHHAGVVEGGRHAPALHSANSCIEKEYLVEIAAFSETVRNRPVPMQRKHSPSAMCENPRMKPLPSHLVQVEAMSVLLWFDAPSYTLLVWCQHLKQEICIPMPLFIEVAYRLKCSVR
jgi:hypothetical protein